MRGAFGAFLLLALLRPSTTAFGLGAGQELIRVPQDELDLQMAVDAARPGDVIVLDQGTYPGDVVVPKHLHDITIRGVDRNTVILDGDDIRANAIRVEADGVALESMTAHNFKGNGFYWQEVEGFVGRYLTVYNVGLYGIYAIESRDGLFEHSFVSGAADAAFYIGECNPCDTVLTDLTARLSAVGYSGTNASGDVVVKDSRWELNGVGILPNSYDVGIAPPPQRSGTFTGNVVRGSGTVDVPVNTPLRGFRGIGIGIAGGSDNIVDNNTVEDSGRYGIAVFSSIDAKENRWTPEGNRITSNHVEGSGIADLALADGSGEDNCFEENNHETALPPSLDGLCDQALEGSPEAARKLVLPPPELAELLPSLKQAPSYTEMEAPGPQPVQPSAESLPADGPGPFPFGAVAFAVGSGLLLARLFRPAPALVPVAGGILVAAGSVAILMSL
jgi:parallel beta-helix repeat protein